MPKVDKNTFVCNECGANFGRWHGQCTSCNAWNSVVAFNEAPSSIKRNKNGRTGQSSGYAGVAGGQAQKINNISSIESEKTLTGIGELDRVLGNGVTTGSVNLLTGDPGSGKTTLLTDLVAVMSKLGNTLYSTAEESLSQFKNRLARMKCDYDPDNFYLMAETSVETIIEEMTEKKIKFCVVDSIQAVTTSESNGSPGSPSQVTNSAKLLTQYCKQFDVTMFIIAHVNKSSEVAGPITLVHIVDSLLHVDVNEGQIRSLRANKNRFGNLDEVGIFRMTQRGMISVDNPSEIFLSGSSNDSPGSAITCIRKGNRNLLLEIQCLTTEPEAEFIQRVCVGISLNRVKMLTGVLRKHTKTKIYHDMYFNIVGGIKIDESEACIDLALIACLLSSLNEFIIPRTYCIMGEVSLNGDVRPIDSGVPRVKEAAQHGFTDIFIPKRNHHKSMEGLGAKIHVVETIHDLIKAIT